MPQRRVFVSHIHEEAAVAGIIREWVTDVFSGYGVTAFLSSDRDALPAGRKWLDVVRENLDGSEALIAVLSPQALARPWPNIELGAAWIRGIAVMPFCHSGLRTDALPRPFGDFQGINIDADNPGRDLLGGVADALKVKHPGKLDFALFKRQLVEAAGSVRHAEAASAPAPAAPDLPEEQVRILRFLAEMMNSGREEVHMEELAGGANVKPASLKFHVNSLHDRDFVHIAYYHGGPDVSLRPDGSQWLLEHNLMPE